MSTLLTPRDAAMRLGISYPTIKQWIYHGKLKAVKTPGGHYRIAEADLDKLLHKSKRPDAPVRKGPRTVSGRNQLVGRVLEVKIDGLLAQVKLSIGDQTITSIITSESAREMSLKIGDTAAALIKATEVMVIKP
jgi:molybdopterin-binding protein